jgi:hypothetical protein
LGRAKTLVSISGCGCDIDHVHGGRLLKSVILVQFTTICLSATKRVTEIALTSMVLEPTLLTSWLPTPFTLLPPSANPRRLLRRPYLVGRYPPRRKSLRGRHYEKLRRDSTSYLYDASLGLTHADMDSVESTFSALKPSLDEFTSLLTGQPGDLPGPRNSRGRLCDCTA